MTEYVFEATDEAVTDRFGAALAKALPRGAVVCLLGTLGAGKTRLVQAIAAARGVAREDVVSPTFVLLQQYEGDALINHLDLKNVVLVGHSTGGGEVTRYIGRHGSKRVEKVVLIAAVPPLLLKTDANPEGLPIEVFDGLRASLAKDPSQFYKDFAFMFYGANRAGAKVSQGILDQFWLWSMQAGTKNAYESVKAFSETDFTEDLRKFDVPTLVLHGEDDQIVPVKDSARKSAKLIKSAKDIYYPGAPHGLTATHQDQVNADLLAFIRT